LKEKVSREMFEGENVSEEKEIVFKMENNNFTS